MMFEYKSNSQIKQMSIEELEKYYIALRKYEYLRDKDSKINGMLRSQIINKVLTYFLKTFGRIIDGRTVNIINKENKINLSKGPKIFVVTHVGRYDIETAIEIVNQKNYFMLSDPGETYRDFDGLMLKGKGAIFFSTKDRGIKTNDFAYKSYLEFITKYNLSDEIYTFEQYKSDFKEQIEELMVISDSQIAEQTAIKILKQNGNILMFPSGAWNISPNLPENKLFNGAVRMSLETNAEIVPMAIEVYDKKYYFNMGEPFHFDNNGMKSLSDLSDELRDKLATLKYEIWEQLPVVSRKEYNQVFEDAYKEFLDVIMKYTENGYTVDEIKRTTFHVKDDWRDVFEYVQDYNGMYRKVIKFNNDSFESEKVYRKSR